MNIAVKNFPRFKLISTTRDRFQFNESSSGRLIKSGLSTAMTVGRKCDGIYFSQVDFSFSFYGIVVAITVIYYFDTITLLCDVIPRLKRSAGLQFSFRADLYIFIICAIIER